MKIEHFILKISYLFKILADIFYTFKTNFNFKFNFFVVLLFANK